jgi:dATP pyrophosphohydrolase
MPRIVSEQVEVFPFRRRAELVECLMLQRADGDTLGGTWHAVHGAIEGRETAVQAAVRELREESGLSPLRFWQIDYVSVFFLAATDTIHMNPIFGAEIDPAAAVSLSSEHKAFQWLPLAAAIEQFMWPNQRRALREIRKQVIQAGPGEPHLRIDLGQVTRG